MCHLRRSSPTLKPTPSPPPIAKGMGRSEKRIERKTAVVQVCEIGEEVACLPGSVVSVIVAEDYKDGNESI